MVEIADPIFHGVGLAMVVASVALIRKGRFYGEQSERVSETEISEIASLERGTVAIEGTARVDEDAGTVQAALSGEEALVSRTRVVVDDDRHDEESGADRRVLHEEQRTVPFLVEDGSGTVRVDPPEQADVRLDEKAVYERGHGVTLPNSPTIPRPLRTER